ncbi:MAG: hypothetical protein HY327_01975, partial [Chloroflexi bacterium]|nr:hypothetical protein [Chloroflexota bacterium]
MNLRTLTIILAVVTLMALCVCAIFVAVLLPQVIQRASPAIAQPAQNPTPRAQAIAGPSPTRPANNYT